MIRSCIGKTFLLLTALAILSCTVYAETITSISPTSVAAGSGNLTLTVNGSGFEQYSTILFNGQWLTTTHVSTTTLRAVVPSSYLITAAKVPVEVGNASTGTISNTLAFTITSGTGGGGGSTGAHVTIHVTSPTQNQTVCSPVTLIASAVTSTTGASISKWQVLNQSGTVLWSTATATSSIKPELKLAAGAQTLQIKAWDSSGYSAYSTVAFTVSTATPPCGGTTSSTVKWHACLYTRNGETYQAMQFQPSQPMTGVLQSELYTGPGCVPANWNDQLNDVGSPSSWGTMGYLYWFIHRPNQNNMSAIWTLGNQSSGCVNYATAPACY